MRQDVDQFIEKVAFIYLDDFKTHVWSAESFMGGFKGNSIRKLHANLLQSIGKGEEKSQQTFAKRIFFEKYKSPQKFKTYTETVTPENFKHPSGPGGNRL